MNTTDQNNIDLVNEINDRLYRSRNILIFNTSENDIISDEAVVNDLISNMKVSVSISKIQRIGNLSIKNRPLRITFNEASDVITILKSKSKLRNTDKYKNLWINSDLTTIQREKMKSLRLELQQKRRTTGKEIGLLNAFMEFPHFFKKLIQPGQSDFNLSGIRFTNNNIGLNYNTDKSHVTGNIIYESFVSLNLFQMNE
ncbi:uncharacterized protein LOC126905053 [Daktulosphaira vitifoliae]|uniref:uncharacterized protein LOC126905053 n=1 Tax=Daktulosphaira vitifoliae TaxID=58002 RepID=UPI0021A9E363|nr:uncharacterized protein LOC126905053 [Daktulosphaira vitifoliae]